MPPSEPAQALIAALQLEPLPGEGGFFRQTWRNETASAILFLLTTENFSALHRLAQDEMWHFYTGDRVEHVQLAPDGAAHRTRMGSDVLGGDVSQVIVPPGMWQAARLDPSAATHQGFALLGCTVSPPWDERGCTIGARAELVREYPAHAQLILGLTR
jgi:uncharacterized protein